MINKGTAAAAATVSMDRLCRSCMSDEFDLTEMRNVFEIKESVAGQCLQIDEMLMACAPIQISKGDGFPMHVCVGCVEKLKTAYGFKKQLERTDTALRKIRVKEESLEAEVNVADYLHIIDDELEGNGEKADANAFACPLCAKVLSTKKGLTLHRIRSHSERNRVRRRREQQRQEDTIKEKKQSQHNAKPFHCFECGEGFEKAYHLARHKKMHTIDNVEMVKEEDQEQRPNDVDDGVEELENNVECIDNDYDDDEDDREYGVGGKDDDDDDEDEEDDDNDLNYFDNQLNYDEKNNVMGKSYRQRKRRGRKHNSKIAKEMQCEFCDRKFKYRKSFIHHMQTEHGMSDESDVPLSTYVTNPIKVEANGDALPNRQTDNDNQMTIETYATTTTSITTAAAAAAAAAAVVVVVDDALVNCEQQQQQQTLACIAEESNNIELETLTDGGDVESERKEKKVHICHVCNSRFDRANHLTRHMVLHRHLLTHKCDRCEKCFATQEHLVKHAQEDHIDKPYGCTLCDKPFNRGEHLIRHLKNHSISNSRKGNHHVIKKVQCSICDEVFSKVENLARHTKIHLQHDKRHVCSECGRAFNRLDNLKTHQRTHTSLTSKLHLCIYCGKEFSNSSNMIVHMRRHTGERPYKCTVCAKGFPRSHDLKCHERTHSGEKPYLCTLCGKSFNKSNKLLRHTRIHTGERPYVCNLCGRAFTQSNDLALHTRRHTGSRPYACGVCPARFIQSGQLKLHRRSMGHWMETRPDLKGGYRVEPVTPLSNPTPIRFKTHGKQTTTLAPTTTPPTTTTTTTINIIPSSSTLATIKMEKDGQDINFQSNAHQQQQQEQCNWQVDNNVPDTTTTMLQQTLGDQVDGATIAGHLINIDHYRSKLIHQLQEGSLVSFTVIDSLDGEHGVVGAGCAVVADADTAAELLQVVSNADVNAQSQLRLTAAQLTSLKSDTDVELVAEDSSITSMIVPVTATATQEDAYVSGKYHYQSSS